MTKQSTDRRWILKTLEETIALGEAMNKELPDLKLLLLKGPLGAGKTTLVKGIAKSLGIEEPITSPTFSLAQHYLQGTPPLIHLDLFRLEEPNAANELFLQEEEEANSLGALIVVEWPERLRLDFPEAWLLRLDHLPNNQRSAHLLRATREAINSSTWD